MFEISSSHIVSIERIKVNRKSYIRILVSFIFKRLLEKVVQVDKNFQFDKVSRELSSRFYSECHPSGLSFEVKSLYTSLAGCISSALYPVQPSCIMYHLVFQHTFRILQTYQAARKFRSALVK